MATGYTNTFITIAPDCPTTVEATPPKATSIAGLEYAILTTMPYRLTGDELLFAVHLRHKGISEDDGDLVAIRAAFFARPHPCLRTSMLPKRYGWGVHYDNASRIALYGVETVEYRLFAAREDLKVIPAMRNRRP
jgi:hypothetical protein